MVSQPVLVTISNADGTVTVSIEPVTIRFQKMVPAMVYGLPEGDDEDNTVIDPSGVQATIEISFVDDVSSLISGTLATLWNSFVTGDTARTDKLTLNIDASTLVKYGRVVDLRIEGFDRTKGKVKATLLFRVGSLQG